MILTGCLKSTTALVAGVICFSGWKTELTRKEFFYFNNVVGVEINVNKVFYKPEKLRDVAEILEDIASLDEELQRLEEELIL